MEEIWKIIDGYPNYMVSNLGRVKTLNYKRSGREKIMSLLDNGLGYFKVCLCSNGKVKQLYVHRLVAEAFLDNPNNLSEVNHKDENPSNNCVSNLEYCDHKYNMIYGTRNERASKKLINHPNKSKVILQYDLNGNFIKEFPSAAEVERQLNISTQNVTACCRGEYKYTHGYIFSYQSLL